MTTYHRLLVPLDGSGMPEGAIAASIDLARQLNAGITAFVAEPELEMPLAGDETPRTADPFCDPEPYDPATVERTMTAFELAAARAGIGFDRRQVRGRVTGERLVAQVRSCGCDMIVMVAQGRGAFGEYLYGSQAKALLAGSHIPLLILQGPLPH
jgi:nucleotide-binding universal stress UspA family protein